MKLFNHTIKEKATLEMIYLAANGKVTQRFVRVVEIHNAHMLAYCYSRKRLRMFTFENILAVRKTDGGLSA
ncbi:hypothetical protein KFZ56_05855 [Virgibacillus sp. NKC19-3]|uniref:hypothetical protein n=1 Tax=Virgibacillus saliphilus TaxID=2831674 RepID=UPI001C9A9AB2|nr:hypothetical protein [Virgibacillus sp. NKC19-3]MBY7142610.1 hypothetical protein [Virgibacillus sp. NKC19-3]